MVTEPASVLDVRTTPHEDILARVERAFGLVLNRETVVYGQHGATEGFASSTGRWVRIERRGQHREPGPAWIGLEAAAAITGVRKPRWWGSMTVADPARGVVWRADELEYVDVPVVGTAAAAADLPPEWWDGLRASLQALAAHRSNRVGMSQAHLTRRIGEVFPGVDTTVEEWAVAHADLHFGNLTVAGHILDWEDWGMAPRGLDAATLWRSCLPLPELAARVQREFAVDLQTRSGRLAQLLVCANAIRIARRRGAATALSEPAAVAAQELLVQLAQAIPRVR